VYEGLLNPNNALSITNYIPLASGRLKKRKGLHKEFEVAGANPVLHLDRYTSNVLIYSYANSTAVYNEDTGVKTVIKNDWTASTSFTGVRYGDYYFICNGKDKIVRISQTLAYDAQTANFTAGKILTGGTSGATAIILSDADGGATGTLTLGNISGVFVDNETITDNNGTPGSATVNGTLTYVATTVSAAPVCSHLAILNARLIASNLSTDPSACQYSAVDAGTNPPFDTWSNTSTATAGGIVRDGKAGPILATEILGDIVVNFAQYGKWAFRIEQIDSSGTIVKIDQTVIDIEDLGGVSALMTNKGIFYVNKAGVHLLTSLGQSNIPFSQQSFNISTALDSAYFENIDFTGSTMAYDRVREILYVSCRKSSSSNNYVIAYNTQTKAFARISGWNIASFFMDVDSSIWGGSSLATKVYRCFTDNDDDGTKITTEYYQPINVGDPNTWRQLLQFMIQAELSPSSVLTIGFDKVLPTGQVLSNVNTYTMAPQYAVTGETGWGSMAYAGGYGESIVTLPLPCYDQFKPFIRNYHDIRVRITSFDRVPHTVNLFTADVKETTPIRQRMITQIT